MRHCELCYRKKWSLDNNLILNVNILLYIFCIFSPVMGIPYFSLDLNFPCLYKYLQLSDKLRPTFLCTSINSQIKFASWAIVDVIFVRNNEKVVPEGCFSFPSPMNTFSRAYPWLSRRLTGLRVSEVLCGKQCPWAENAWASTGNIDQLFLNVPRSTYVWKQNGLWTCACCISSASSSARRHVMREITIQPSGVRVLWGKIILHVFERVNTDYGEAAYCFARRLYRVSAARVITWSHLRAVRSIKIY